MYERTMFDKRVGKLSGKNIVKGEKEFKSRLFDVRKVITADPVVQEFLDWSGEATGEIIEEEDVMTEMQKKNLGGTSIGSIARSTGSIP